LANLNPAIRYLNAQKQTVADFLAGPEQGIADTLPTVQGQPSARHALRNALYVSSESVSVQPQRLPTNRGNGYLQPHAIGDQQASANGSIFPNFDCKPSGGERSAGDGGSPPVGPGFAPCVVSPPFPGIFGGKQAPDIYADP